MLGKRKDLALLVAVAFIALGSTYYLFFHQSQDGLDLNSEEDHLALVQDKKNELRHKRSGSLVWKEADLEEKLFQNDQVFTQDNSTSTILFKDESKVEMAPQTLLKISQKGKTTNLDLISGFVLATLKKDSDQLLLKSGDTEVNLKGHTAGSIQLSKTDNENKVTVLKGEVSLEVNGKKVLLKNNQELSIDAQGKTQVQDLEIILTSPTSGQTIFFKERPQVKLGWKTNKDISNFTIKIARNFDLKNPRVLTFEGRSGVVSLNPGHYFWKAQAFDSLSKKTVSSKISSFIVEEDLPPTLLSPQNGEALVTSQKLDKVLFYWSSQSSPQYQVEIYQGNKVTFQQSVGSNRVKISNLKPGDYRWRVKVADPKRPDANWSDFSQFSFSKEIQNAKPESQLPKENEVFSIGKNVGNEINFQWKGSKKLSYTLRVALDKEMKALVLKANVNDIRFTWNPEVFGRYYWQVQTKVLDKTPFLSEVRSFELQAAAPNNSSPLDQETVILREPGPVYLNWDDVYFKATQLDNYQIQIARDATMEELLVNETTQDSEYLWPSPEFGDLHWRVGSNPYKAKGLFSRPFQFRVEKSKPPLPPKLLPSIEVKIEFKNRQSSVSRQGRFPAAQNEETTVTLNWPEVEYVGSYVLQIFQDRRRTKKVLDLEVTENQFIWKNPKPGVYYMRIAAIDKWNQQGPFSELSQLRIAYDLRELSRPRAYSPAPKALIDHDLNSIKLSWQKMNYAKKYQVQVIEKKSGRLVFDQKVFSNRFTIPKKTLANGSYGWKVRAYHSERDFLSSRERSFFAARTQAQKSKEESIADGDENPDEKSGDDKKSQKKKKKEFWAMEKQQETQFRFLYAPSTLSYDVTSSNTNSIQVTGNDAKNHFLGLYLDVKKGLSNNKYLYANLYYSQGTIFDTSTTNVTVTNNTYKRLDAYAGYGLFRREYQKSEIGLDLGVRLAQATAVNNTSTVSASTVQETYILPNAHLFYRFWTSRFEHHLYGEVGALSSLFGNIGYDLHIHSAKPSRYFYVLGMDLFHHIYTYDASNDEREITASTIRLKAGLGLFF